MTNTVLACRNLSKRFADGNLETEVLRDIDLTIRQGETLAIVGSSGSGKSTLLHLLGGLDSPSEGQVFVQDQDLTKLSTKATSQLRNRSLGFVYQFHHLLGEFTATENVAMPLIIGGMKPNAALEEAAELLEKVGLGHRLRHKPAELSGGERQRAALARALITRPACLLADEPTGNLDHRTATDIFDLVMELNAELDTALVVVTHDTSLAQRMQRQLTLIDGHLGE